MLAIGCSLVIQPYSNALVHAAKITQIMQNPITKVDALIEVEIKFRLNTNRALPKLTDPSFVQVSTTYSGPCKNS